MNFLPESNDWKKIESKNQTIALNIFFVQNNKEEIKQAYISKHKSERKDKVILLMITDGERWH